jgi:hypothetical protein
MSFFDNPNRIPENYGLRIAAGLIVYFLIMHFAGFGTNVEFRIGNFVVLILGIYFGLKKFKDSHQHHINYFRALIVGAGIGAVGSALFGVFMFIFLETDPNMMKTITEIEPLGHYLNPYMAAFIVALEGVFSGLMVTFLLTNYISSDEVEQS